MLFWCALTSIKATFGTQQEESISDPKSNIVTLQEHKTSSVSTELFKGCAALLGSAFFVSALNDKQLLCSIKAHNHWNISARCMNSICASIILFLANGKTINEQIFFNAQAIMTAAMSGIGAYILGKYGVTKLYYAFKNRKIYEKIKNSRRSLTHRSVKI